MFFFYIFLQGNAFYLIHVFIQVFEQIKIIFAIVNIFPHFSGIVVIGNVHFYVNTLLCDGNTMIDITYILQLMNEKFQVFFLFYSQQGVHQKTQAKNYES